MHGISAWYNKENCALFRTQEKETGELESVEMFISPVLYQIENFTDNTEIRLDQKNSGT